MATIPDAIAEDALYPSTDGQPMGESEWHVDAIFALYQMLRSHFAGRPDVFVAADMFLYYEEGRPSQVKAPDCMVVFGVERRKRKTFKTWVERAVPAVVFEVSSSETYQEDLGPKSEVYARLGVAEYYVFDPLGERLDPPLLGLRLRDGAYEPLPPDADGGLTSAALGLRIVPEGDFLRLIDAQTNEPLVAFWELADATERARLELAAERRRVQAERRLAEHRRRLLSSERSRAKAMAEELEIQRRINEVMTEELEARRRLAELAGQIAAARAVAIEAQQRVVESERRAADAERRRGDELAAEVERLRNELNDRGVEGA